MKYVPVEVKENFNVTKKHPLKEAAVLSASIILILAFLYIVSGLISDVLARHIPISVEKDIGAIISLNIPYKKNMKKSRELQVLLDKMLEKSSIETIFPLKVYVVENRTVNALALPGGTILLFTGLLDKMKSDEETAFVLAHEAGHFHNRDHMKSLGRSLIMYTVLSIMNIGHGDISFTGITDLLELERSRSQEEEADLFAVNLVRNYYGSIDGAVEFMKMMAEKSKAPKIAKYFMTHPHPEERLQKILEYKDH